MPNRYFAILFNVVFFSPLLLYAQINIEEPIVIEVHANTNGWTNSGIHVKEGDFVMFEASGTVDLGMITKNIDPTGSTNPFLQRYNMFKEYRHGILLCRNGNDLIPTVSKDVPHPGSELDAQEFDKELIPLPLRDDFDEDAFVGNYFTATKDQDLLFAINDEKISDNDKEFSVKITVVRATKIPYLHGEFNFAKYVDHYKGNLPVCIDQDFLPNYDANAEDPHVTENGGLWFGGENENGHFYLVINPLGSYNGTLKQAVDLLKKNIYYIFPNGAVDKTLTSTPGKSIVLFGHLYELTFMEWEVIASEVSDFHFTFTTHGIWHILRGSATHGLFKDNCGNLYMFQQGKGIVEEGTAREETNLFLAPRMWQDMAENMKKILAKNQN